MPPMVFVRLVVVLSILCAASVPVPALAASTVPIDEGLVSEALQKTMCSEETGGIDGGAVSSEGTLTLSSLGDFVLSTADGLSITISDDGYVKQISVDTQVISASLIQPVVVTDANTHQTSTMGGSVASVGSTLQQTGIRLQHDINVTYVPHGGYIELLIDIENMGAAERATEFSVRASVQNTNAYWWQGANRRLSVAPTGHYEYVCQDTNRVPDIGREKMSWLPFSVVETNGKAVAMAVRLDYPAHFFMGYDSPGKTLFCNYSLGFSEIPTWSPGVAKIALILYKVDAKWGIRSAAARYYEFFPAWFSSTRAGPGAEAINGPLEVPDSGRLAYQHANLIGLRYFGNGDLFGWWNPYVGFTNVAYGVGSLPYINPVGIRLRCTLQQYQTHDYLGVLGMYTASGVLVNETAATMIRNTLMVDNDGVPCASFVNWTNDFYCEFLLSPVLINHDFVSPEMDNLTSDELTVTDLFDYYSKWAIMPSYEDHERYDAEPVGIFFDNVGSGTADFNQSHLVYCRLPLGYAYDETTDEFVPVQWSSSTEVELLQAMRAGVHADYFSDMVIYGNLGCAWPNGMFQAPYLDAGLQEQALDGWGFGGVNFWQWEEGLNSRLMMYQKPISGMDYDIGSRDHTLWSIYRYLHYGMFPLMTGAFLRDEDLYAKYVPLADALSEAGWGPLTYAAVENTGDYYVTIERFGHWYADSLHFTVRNWNYTAAEDVGVKVEAGTLAINTEGLIIRELTEDASESYTIDGNLLRFNVDLAANQTKVFRLYRPDSSVIQLKCDIPNTEQATELDLLAIVESNAPLASVYPSVTFADNGTPVGTVLCAALNSTHLYARLLTDIGSGHHIVTATATEYNDVVTIAPSFSLSQTVDVTARVTLPLDWPYWIEIHLETGGISRGSAYARVPLDLQTVADSLELTELPDPSTFRLVHSTGVVQCQWLPDLEGGDSGLLVFPASAADVVDITGISDLFTLYFETESGQAKPETIDLGFSFNRVGKYGVQIPNGTMILFSPLGANCYRTHMIPSYLSLGYAFTSLVQGAWEGALGEYECFQMTVLNAGPNVIRIAAVHKPSGPYAEYGTIIHVYASGDIENWVTIRYAEECQDQFSIWREYTWGGSRVGCYMGPGDRPVIIPNGEQNLTITDFTEPWFGQRLGDGRYSFDLVLSPTPESAMISTTWVQDETRFTQAAFNSSETAVYRFVHVYGVGDMESAVEHARSWLDMNVTLTYHTRTGGSRFDPTPLVLGAAGVGLAAVATVLVMRRKQSNPASRNEVS